MRHFNDPTELSPEQRLREVAGILARGVLRLWQRRLLTGEATAPLSKTAPESSAGRLEVSGETVLSVHNG